jgi:sarcosine oxidase subunit gamma
MLDRRSAIAEALVQGGRDGANGARACAIGEIRGWSLLQVAGFADTIGDVEAALSHLLETPLPDRIGVAVSAGAHSILRTGPLQFWILGPEADDLAARLNSRIGSETGALTSLSHSRTRLFIEGAAAREVLAKGIAIDLDDREFKVGDFALTGLDHTPILLWRQAGERYEIWAMRTFALTLWEWLTDAAWPVGYEVVR